MRCVHRLLLAVGLALTPGLAWGQATAPAPLAKPKSPENPPIKLVLHPAAEPKPALKYVLLPPLLDRRPGNAAVQYNRVTAEQHAFFTDKTFWEKIDDWLQTPIDKFPKEEVAKRITGGAHRMRNGIYEALDLGARCEHVDWDVPIREQQFYEILLPELQQTRSFGKLLALKARLEMAEGKYDDAAKTLRNGYSLARQVAQGPTLIHGLVGIAISGILTKQLQDFVQQPGAPNLYWALANLPHPFIDMRSGFEAEMASLYLSFPELKNLESKDFPPQYWQQLLEKFTSEVNRLVRPAASDATGQRMLTTAFAIAGYPKAKAALVAWGRKPEEVDAMPVAQVILLYTMRTYDELRDDYFKWFSLPSWEAREGLQRVDQAFRSEVESREIIPLASMLLPAVNSVNRAVARNERSFAALRIIEAIRLYGASHDGRLPEKLSDIREAPVPIDPATGKEFIYQRKGDMAVLDAQTPQGTPPGIWGWTPYEIRFATKGK